MPLNSGAIAILVPNSILLTWHHFFSMARGVWHDRSRALRMCELCGRKFHLLEDKKIPSIGVYDKVSFYTLFRALGWLLEEVHVTWAHLEKKRTRLRLYTKSLEETIIQMVETASPTIATALEIDQDGVKNITTASECSRLK
ncbi:hypothetical protein Tco_0513224 [Tanacetum coccineum]